MAQQQPLSTFQRLGEATFLYTPTDDTTFTASTKNTSAPDLVIVCAWAFALPRRTFILAYDPCPVMLVIPTEPLFVLLTRKKLC